MRYRVLAALALSVMVSMAGAQEKKPASRPVAARWTPAPYPKDEVNLVLMGDWGNGKSTQKKVATTMASYVKGTGKQFNAWLSPGDNFYVSLKGPDDYQFQSVFEDMYDAKAVNFPVYAVYGNHDYEKDKPKAEMEYAAAHPESRFKFPARWYRLDFPEDHPLVTVLMLDSDKPRLTKAQWAEELQWMDQELGRSSGAIWKMACAHHPFFSNGSHGDNGVLQVEWGPIFRKHGVDFYLCGHDHDLQQIQVDKWPMSFVVAGGGGQPLTDMRWDKRGPFSRKLYGFAHLRITPEEVDVKFVAGDSKVPVDHRIVHEFVRNKGGEIRVVQTTGHDKPTNRPLRALQGFPERGDAGGQ